MLTHTPEFYQKFIEKSFSVIDKHGNEMPFILKPEQKQILYNLSGMDMILKARQLGMTTLMLAIFTVDFITVENFRCVIVSHEAKSTQRLLDRVKFFLESTKKNAPLVDFPVKMKYASRSELVNEVKNSSFYIGTAGGRAFGRSDTIHALHLSELAFYPEAERFLTGILQAVPQGGRVTIESTANGYNYFQRLWKQNEESPSPFKTHFLPWFATDEYSIPCPKNYDFTDDEYDFANKYHLKRDQLLWRRKQIEKFNGDVDQFNQEYPSSPGDAFIMSGNPVWSPTLLNWYTNHSEEPLLKGDLSGYRPVFVEPNERGMLSVFCEPVEHHQYVIGADVAMGKMIAEGQDESKHTDFSCAQVIDVMTYEQVAVFHGNIDADLFGRQLDMLGRYYNDALICPERNAMGLATISILRELNYPKLYYREKFGYEKERSTGEIGWVTDRESKGLLIADATRLLREKRLYLYDEHTIEELRSFVRTPNGLGEAAAGAHDDRVMAFMIAIQMLSRPQTETRGNPITQIERMNNVAFNFRGVPFDRNGMPVHPSSLGTSMPTYSFE